jgi:PAS domain-containing protein
MYGTAQRAGASQGYKGPNRSPTSTGSTRLVADLILVLSASPGKTRRQSRVMLARVRRSGTFELLTAAAWAGALGYQPDELSGRSLRQLLQLEKGAAGKFVAALLDEEDIRPLEVTLRCKDERRKCFRLYRRFDPYMQAVYVLADEVSEERPEPLRACG